MSAAHVHPEDDHPHPTPADWTWAAKANCMGVDVDLFFVERGAATAPAKAVCRRCVARTECLRHALTTPERYGTWGSYCQDELKGIRKRLRRSRLPVDVFIEREGL